jgi:hypothetical protein
MLVIPLAASMTSFNDMVAVAASKPGTKKPLPLGDGELLWLRVRRRFALALTGATAVEGVLDDSLEFTSSLPSMIQITSCS